MNEIVLDLKNSLKNLEEFNESIDSDIKKIFMKQIDEIKQLKKYNAELQSEVDRLKNGKILTKQEKLDKDEVKKLKAELSRKVEAVEVEVLAKTPEGKIGSYINSDELKNLVEDLKILISYD